jgi:DNA-binding protein HU-beta
MNKSELVEVAAKEAGVTKAVADKVLTAVVDAVVQAVADGESVTLVGFGTFKAAERAERTGKNPKTGAALKIPATVAPKFTAGAAFKAAVAKK